MNNYRYDINNNCLHYHIYSLGEMQMSKWHGGGRFLDEEIQKCYDRIYELLPTPQQLKVKIDEFRLKIS